MQMEDLILKANVLLSIGKIQICPAKNFGQWYESLVKAELWDSN